MTSAANEQREALGLRLRELRRDAGLTGRKLAELAHWHESKVSRIEYGRQTPSELDLRSWCTHTNSLDQLPDLIATLRNIQAAYLEWRWILGTGTRRRQRVSVKLEAESGAMRWYEPLMVPGLLQTPEYAEGVFRKVIGFYGIPDDLDEGVSTRIERQQVLYRGNHRFSFVLGEQALRTTVGSNSVMLGHVETVSAELTITQPREIALYGKVFAQLAEQAVYGDTARSLIMAELDKRR